MQTLVFLQHKTASERSARLRSRIGPELIPIRFELKPKYFAHSVITLLLAETSSIRPLCFINFAGVGPDSEYGNSGTKGKSHASKAVVSRSRGSLHAHFACHANIHSLTCCPAN